MSVQHGHWKQFGTFHAVCHEEPCNWSSNAKTAATINRHAAQHVEQTGHWVEVEKRVWKMVTPS